METVRSRPHHRVPGVVAAAVIVAALFNPAPARADDACTPDTSFVGEYPDDEVDPDWTDNTQGVAHDKDHWFITSNFEQDTPDGKYLLKFPVGFDLGTTIDVDDPPPGVTVDTDAMPAQLKVLGYDHFGDPDQAGGFVFLPIDGGGNGVIGVFRAADLSFVGFEQTPQPGASWIAYNRSQKLLYSAAFGVSAGDGLYRYTVDLDALADTEDVAASIEFLDRFDLLEADGGPLTKAMDFSQGGVFTPWGDLYYVNGSQNTDPDDSPEIERGGVHLFSPSGRLLSESQNGSGAFNFEYHPTDLDAEEPQGIDWWNRNIGTGSPSISGQLHVLLLDNDVSEDDIFFKHYDVAYGCVPQDADTDGDGLTDLDEGYVFETDLFDPDTDDDGLSDGLEVNDLGTDPLAKDSDGDGVPDGDEDHDADGLSNGDEVNVYGTDPVVADTDIDGLSDGEEVNTYHTDPLVADTDGDGLSDGDEVNVYGTDPLVSDTDGDGLTDGDEVNVYGTDPTDADTDDDLLPDGLEVTYGTDPLVEDTDGDGLLDGQDVEFIQNAVDALPASAFDPPGLGTKKAIHSELENAESKLLAGDVDKALVKLASLRVHIDGCGIVPGKGDWIVDCARQIEVRVLVDLLTTNLGA